MLLNNPLLNFRWHKGILATGGKPDTADKVNWLIGQGFGCVVSLESIPNNETSKKLYSELDYSTNYLSEEDVGALDSCKCLKDFGALGKLRMFEFIAQEILHDTPVYIHCSAGINRSRRVAEIFTYYQRLFTVHYIALRANDLEHGDDWDWIRGHEAFSGDMINDAIDVLEEAVTSTDKESCSIATCALTELTAHLRHECFNKRATEKLQRLGWDLNLC